MNVAFPNAQLTHNILNSVTGLANWTTTQKATLQAKHEGFHRSNAVQFITRWQLKAPVTAQ
jgi:hypothetical protein